jgi:hypothetical protein
MSPAAKPPRAQLNVMVDPELQRLLNAVVDASNALDRPMNMRTAVRTATQDWIASALQEPAMADLVSLALQSDMVLPESMRKYSAPDMGALLHDLGRDDLAGIVAPSAVKAPKGRSR